MNFFRLLESTGTDIGQYPQVIDANVGFDIYEKRSSYHLNFTEAISTTIWPIPKLSNKAKKTDLISVSYMGLSSKLLISNKLYIILNDINSKGIQFISSKLIYKKNLEEDYWIVNPHISDFSFLDIKNCNFIYTDAMGKIEISDENFESIEEYIKGYLKNKQDAISIGYPNFRPLFLKKLAIKRDTSIEFFALSGVSGGIGFYVSERLKEVIEKAGCTGIVFKELNEPLF
jgi:hypothetical protein